MKRIRPITDLRKTNEISSMIKDGEPIFVTKNGYGKLVVMDIECFERLMNDVYEAKAINEGLKDLENDKTKDGNLVLTK